MRRLFVAGLMLFVGILGLTASGAAAAPAPAWTIQAIPYPSAFEAGSAYGPDKKGPGYLIQAYNIGAAPTSGEFTIVDTLPAGLLPVPAFPPTAYYGQSGEFFTSETSCSVLGRRITCTGGGDKPVIPGSLVSVVVPVEVQDNAAEKAASSGGFLSESVSVEGGGAVPASTVQPTPVSTTASPFGFLPQPAGLYGLTTNADGSVASQAGSHPDQMTVAGMNLAMNRNDLAPLLPAGGGLRDAVVELPRGTVVNPAAAPRCTEAALESGSIGCPDASQVGTVELALSLGAGFGTGPSVHPVYNLVPPPGYPAELGFEVVQGTYVHLLGSVRSDGSFTLTAAGRDVLARVAVGGVRTTLWGVPSDGSHDAQRGTCLFHFGETGCAVPRTARPFLAMPSSCGGPLTTKAKIDSWEAPGTFVEGTYQSTDLEGNPVGVDGCNRLGFEPSIAARATTDQGDSPSGLDFTLHQPQAEVPPPTPGSSVEVCNRGSWKEATSYSFRWLLDGTPIPGAVTREHEVSSEDAGHSLQCEVSASGSSNGPALATSAPLAVPPAPATPVPAVSVRPSLHTRTQTLTVTGSGGEYLLNYGGKTTPALAFDAGAAEIQESLEGLEPIGAGNVVVSGVSSPYEIAFVGKLAEAEPLFTLSPTQEEKENEEPAPAVLSPTLDCEPGNWSEAPSFAYQWLSSGSPQEGQTASTYAVPVGQPSRTVQCEVTATNSSGSTVAFSVGAPESLIVPDIQPSETDIPLNTANLKDATVNLPEGMSVNPSAANGLEGCSIGQIGLSSPVGSTPVRFVEEPAHCPDASKIGSAEAIVPLLVDEPSFETQLPHPLHGSVYLAKPFDNPFGSLLGLYLVIEDEETGVIAKLAGRVEADPATGQLTTTFAENPELPLEDVKLSLYGGPRASLTSPLACGTHTTTSTLTPWSTPEGADAHPSDSFQTTGNCSASESSAPTGYSFAAGTVDPLAGAFSPFVLKLSRRDGSQHLTGLDLTLPEGLTGKLAGVPYCSEAQIAQARARSNPEEGKLEIQGPSCPQASEVGTVTVAAGSGPSPIYVTGHAYLAGPYKGAPLSMAIVTPAVAGPFDLGVVVVRVALEVNLETAQISAKSDPLPTILQGIPLDIRSVAVQLSRPGFTLNPTDCEAASVGAQVSTAAGQIDGLSNRFQVGGCDKLAFKPKLKLQLKGATRRSGHPALKAVVTMPPGGANLARVQVGLPHSEFLDQGNLDKVCTQPQLKAASCPAGAVYGHAKAWSPLLEKPLEGPVYLGVGYGHELPDLVADLNGQIRILAHGKVDTTKKHGLRNTFEVIPDAPVSRIVLEMKGGKKYGLLENSENVCHKTQRVSARFAAQNGKVAQLHPKIANGCGGKHHKRHARHHGKHRG
ncbi:MAG TPA: hypothetical protein VFK14_11785 [Solirubrobacterales bacterium]|nr:hypothetical protein [Solirubrobacterales bacterium]